MSTSITMNSTTQTGKQISRSITSVNPNATNSEISTFVKGLNALTTNTLGSINRVDKTEIDDTLPQLTVSITKEYDNGNAITINGTTVTIELSKVATGDDKPFITLNTSLNNVRFVPETIILNQKGTSVVPLALDKSSTSSDGEVPYYSVELWGTEDTGTWTLTFSDTNTYLGLTITINVTA